MSKRKSYNAIKSKLAHASNRLKKVCLSMTQLDADRGVLIRNYETGKPFILSHGEADVFNSLKYKWYVLLLVYKVEKNGKHGIFSHPLPMKKSYSHAELTSYLAGKHELAVNQQARLGNKVINIGWIGLPYPPAITDELDEQLINLMDYSEAWQ